MPTILWSYLCFSFSGGSILCTQWPLWCWWDVSRTHLFYPNMARGSTTLWHCIRRDWSRAPWDERDDSWSCFSVFFSFMFRDVHYPCALVHWYSTVGTEPDEDTGLWVVKPKYKTNGRQSLAIIHLDSIARGAHITGVYGSSFLPEEVHFSHSLDLFCAYFVNSFADHHTHEFLTT